MTANPAELIAGMATTGNVSKADFTAWAKARVPQVLADVTEIRNTSLAGQLLLFLKSNGGSYYLDTADTTTSDDGVNCIISSDGKRFKPISALAAVSQLNTFKGAVTIAAGTGIAISNVTGTITVTNTAPAPVVAKVIGKLSTPPGSPTTGDAYIVVPTGTGAWASHNNVIATWSGSAWTFNTPASNDLVWDDTLHQLNYYDSTASAYAVFAPSTTITPEQFGAVGDGTTDDTVALIAFLAAAAGKTGVFTPGKTYMFNANPSTSHQLVVQSNTHLIGYGSTLKALATAGSNCGNLWLCDSTEGTLIGPSGVTIEGLTVHGNATARRTAGSFSGVGAAATFFLISCTNCHVRDCTSIDAEGDGFYMGGDDTQGGACLYCSFDHCTASLSGRNAYSFVGTVGCDAYHCIAHDITFGSAHSNISDGFDCEPDGSTTRNIGLTLTSCKAISCTEAGLAAHGASANNIHVNWISPYTQSCGVGYYAANTSPNIRVIAARYFGNTTNFTNVAEAIASFP